VNFFVTGTDTGVGKTHTIVQLLRLLRASGEPAVAFKPICCGDRRDAERLLEASGNGLTIDEVNPLWLKTPVAPIVAAKSEDIQIDIEDLLAAFRTLQERVRHVIVEGVGGWLVPIRSDYFVSDLAAEMKLPVLVVAQNRLGCLNHSALTERSIEAHGLSCAAIVLNTLSRADDVAAQTNAEILGKILHAPLLTGLTEEMSELPADWRQMIYCSVAAGMSLE